ncbi:MAG TPA: TIM-barrel domain-containing protein, partial [Verrucomicrobiae bacterium]|nr:TIM-barrel domain-containing protein [Verrucomicrobiae bacterium]
MPKTSGWELGNDAPDLYVFLPGGDYRKLRSDFLKLTGPTEMVPLYALGAFDSRWYDYSETTALEQIEAYRERKIPLDVLVIDTGWRQGASTGYQPNTSLFPDLPRFFREAHAKHVRIMFNDHPEPVAKEALAPREIQYRFAALSGLLKAGLNIWWYDRNWMVSLLTPAPNLRKEVWGMRLYHDMTQRVKPALRPMIMANVDGIDNGLRKHPPDVAAHRFPIQWTGDIGSGFEFLRRAVENAVHSGVQALFPYESDDLGGHTSNPSTEEYIRWIEYGALSPIYRPHCTHNLMRMPWTFGPEVERVARRFLNMRYRLLPVFYEAAHKNYETGEPLLRRLDLDYPRFTEASRNDEYLIGHGILVAPVLQGSLKPVPVEWLKTSAGKPGLEGDYFNNEKLSGSPVLSRRGKTVDFNWGTGSPDPNVHNNEFSARWTGIIQVPRSVGDVTLATVEDDGVRVWIDGILAINAWGPHDSALTEASVELTAGKAHQLRIEYQELQYNVRLRLLWRSTKVITAARD